MSNELETRIAGELEQFKRDKVYKTLNYLDSPQGPRVTMEGRGEVIVLSSNNYLGLSNHPDIVGAGKRALDRFGAGTASVRFICGTFSIHRELEHACARLVGTQESLSFVSCWNANEAVPATLLTDRTTALPALTCAAVSSPSTSAQRSALVRSTTGVAPLSQARVSDRSRRRTLSFPARASTTKITSMFAARICSDVTLPAALRESLVRRGKTAWMTPLAWRSGRSKATQSPAAGNSAGPEA